MSDEPSERDDGPYKGWSIAAIIHNYVVIRGDLSEQYARDQLADLLAERIAQARREGAADLSDANLARIHEAALKCGLTFDPLRAALRGDV